MSCATRNRPRAEVGAVVLALCTLVWAHSASAEQSVNRISDVRVAERGPQTVVTVVGSHRPAYNVYSLRSPDRLVVDLSRSRIDGVPSRVSARTDQVDGVTVSQRSGRRGRQGRLVINLREEAAYRTQVQGNNLIITVTGAPESADSSSGGDSVRRARLEREREEVLLRRVRADAQEALEERERHEQAIAEARRVLAQKGNAGALAAAAERARADAERAMRRAEARREQAESRAREAEELAERRGQALRQAQERAEQLASRAQELQAQAAAATKARNAARARLQASGSSGRASAARELRRLTQAAAVAERQAAQADSARERAESEASHQREALEGVQEQLTAARRALTEVRRVASEAEEAHQAATARAEVAERQVAQEQAARREAEQRAQSAEQLRENAERALEQARQRQQRAEQLAHARSESLREAQQQAQNLTNAARAARERAERAERARTEAEAQARRAQEQARAALAARREAESRARQGSSESRDRARREAERLAREASEAQRAAVRAQAARQQAEREAQRLTNESSRVQAQLQAAQSSLENAREAAEAAERRATAAERAQEQATTQLAQVQQEAEAARREAQVARAAQRRAEQAAAEAQRVANARIEQAERRAQAAEARAERAASTVVERAQSEAEREVQQAQARAQAAVREAERRAQVEARAAQQRAQQQVREAQERLQQATRLAQRRARELARRAEANSAVRERLARQLAEARAAQERAEAAANAAQASAGTASQRAEAQRVEAIEAAQARAAAAVREAEERAQAAVAAAEREAREAREQAQQRAAAEIREARAEAEQRVSAAEEEAQRARERAEAAAADAARQIRVANERAAASIRQAEARAEAAEERAEAAEERAEAAAREANVAQNGATPRESVPATPPRRSGRLTQEEIRLQRLAAMRGEEAAAEQRPAGEPASQDDAARETAAIRDVRFSHDDDVHRVTIDLSGRVEYTLARDAVGNATLELHGVQVPELMSRTLDVSEFDGPVASVSTFARDNSEDAVVEVDVLNAARSTVRRDGNRVVLEFHERPNQQRAEASEASSDERRASAEEDRPGSVVVAREDVGEFQYGDEETAGFVSSAPLEQRRVRRRRNYRGRRIDLDFKDADIHNILRLLSDVGRVNIIAADDVSGTVTIKMRNVPWDQALDVILRSKGLGMVREGNMIRVAPLTQLEKEREMELARRKHAIQLAPLETRIIPISYAMAEELVPRAEDLLSGRGNISMDERTNVLIARDLAANLDQIEELVRALDTQTPQVLIEARIVEATSLYARQIGIQWGGDYSASAATGNPTGIAFPSSIGVAGGATDNETPIGGLGLTQSATPNPNFAVNLPATVGTGAGGALALTMGSVDNNAHLNVRLSALEDTGTLRIISSPRILTMDNSEAHIEQGTMIPYSQVSAQGVQTAFQEAKLNLTVTPHVTADGSVMLKMSITRDEPDFNNTGARGDPTILKREAETQFLVHDGHTVVIGGIYTRNSGVNYSQVPGLAKIPILGWLFKNRQESDRRSEMLIFITPRIVNRAESIGR